MLARTQMSVSVPVTTSEVTPRARSAPSSAGDPAPARRLSKPARLRDFERLTRIDEAALHVHHERRRPARLELQHLLEVPHPGPEYALVKPG